MSTPKVYIIVERDPRAKTLQVRLGLGGSAYRLLGPRPCSGSEIFSSRVLTHRDADEIRRYLNEAFPDYSDPLRPEVEELRRSDAWAEHPDPTLSREEWMTEVSDDNTQLGYWEWVSHALDDREYDANNS